MVTRQPNPPSRSSYILCYALYVVLIALVAVVVFIIWRQTVLNVILAVNGRDYGNTLIYFVCMIAMGLMAFIVVISGEPYLRKGVVRGQLLRHFARLAIPFVIAGVIGVIVNLWAVDAITNPAWQPDRSVAGLSQTKARAAA